MATKQAVIDFIKTDRTIRSARDLYNKFPNKSLATQQYIARIAATPQNIKIVCYELCKLVGIPERQLNALLTSAVTAKLIAVKKTASLVATSVEDLLLVFDEEKATDKELKEIAKKFSLIFAPTKFEKGVKGTNERKRILKALLGLETKELPKNNKALDIEIAKYNKANIDVILAKKAALITSKLQELPTEQKQSIKLRDQFPFLKNKDCPAVLKLLVADLITAHETFVANQPLLHENASAPALKKLSGTVVASYIEKKQAFTELDYYKKNLALLGVHPIFEQLIQEEGILKLATPDLTKKISNLVGNINRNKKKEKEATLPEQKQMYNKLHQEQQKLKEFAEKALSNR